MPKACTTGSRIGERIRIAGRVSRNMPTTIRKTFTASSPTIGLATYSVIQPAASWGSRSVVITQPITTETAMMNMITAVVYTDSTMHFQSRSQVSSRWAMPTSRA